MARPLRIEYEDAYYHVMNRGKNRQIIYPDKEYYEKFHGVSFVDMRCPISKNNNISETDPMISPGIPDNWTLECIDA